ncbi:MAG TPA: hypothetical protein VF109_03330 [Mycobacteriales bacterium]
MADSDPVPDTAMDTGSEDGEPFTETEGTPLSDEERAILDRLRESSATAPPSAEVPEDSEEAFAAADDDAPLPAYTTPQDDSPPDPLDPVFREPE